MCRRKPSWIAIIAFNVLCLWSRGAWCQLAQTSGPYKVLTIVFDPARNAPPGHFLSSSFLTVHWPRKIATPRLVNSGPATDT